MECRICKINNKDLLRDIEMILNKSSGIISNADKNELLKKYTAEEDAELIKTLNDDECSIHFNFHMAPTYEIPVASNPAKNEDNESLAKDINKDEASVLYKVLTTQAATFNLLSNKINKQIQECGSLSELAIPGNTLAMYRDMGDSIRNTAKAIKEINADVNGSKSGALEGLKSLVKAISEPEKSEETTDLSTDQFDY